MAKLTIVVDDALLLQARKRALGQGTSVNALLRRYLKTYVGNEQSANGMQKFIARAAAIGGRSGRAWKRSKLHQRLSV
jgi:hypothetical protein